MTNNLPLNHLHVTHHTLRIALDYLSCAAEAVADLQKGNLEKLMNGLRLSESRLASATGQKQKQPAKQLFFQLMTFVLFLLILFPPDFLVWCHWMMEEGIKWQPHFLLGEERGKV